jgi:hypothetical protein
MCQSCVNDGALFQATYDKITAFVQAHDAAQFGPAHIVLSDCNVADSHIQWCIGLIDAVLTGVARTEDLKLLESVEWHNDHDPEELRLTRAFLEELLAIPENDR